MKKFVGGDGFQYSRKRELNCQNPILVKPNFPHSALEFLKPDTSGEKDLVLSLQILVITF